MTQKAFSRLSGAAAVGGGILLLIPFGVAWLGIGYVLLISTALWRTEERQPNKELAAHQAAGRRFADHRELKERLGPSGNWSGGGKDLGKLIIHEQQ
jgi:hypothetical protein